MRRHGVAVFSCLATLSVLAKMFAYTKTQIKEIFGSRGRVLIPKVAPYFKAFKFVGRGIPLKQVSAADNLVAFTRCLDENEVDYFLTGGTLLGAIRQNSFAGRPGDIDLGILEKEEKRMLELEPTFALLGFIRDNNYRHFEDKLVFTKWRTPAVDIMIYRPIPRDNVEEVIFFRHRNAVGNEYVCNIDFSKPRNGSIFGFEFPVPTNSEEFIENQYGKSWRTPSAAKHSLIDHNR